MQPVYKIIFTKYANDIFENIIPSSFIQGEQSSHCLI